MQTLPQEVPDFRAPFKISAQHPRHIYMRFPRPPPLPNPLLHEQIINYGTILVLFLIYNMLFHAAFPQPSSCPGADIHGWLLRVSCGFNFHYPGVVNILEETHRCPHESPTQLMPRTGHELCVGHHRGRSSRKRGLCRS